VLVLHKPSVKQSIEADGGDGKILNVSKDKDHAEKSHGLSDPPIFRPAFGINIRSENIIVCSV